MMRLIERRVLPNGDDSVLKLDFNSPQELGEHYAERVRKLLARGFVLDTTGAPMLARAGGYNVIFAVHGDNVSAARTAMVNTQPPQPALPLSGHPEGMAAVPNREIPDGTYTIVRGDQRRTFRVTTKTDGNFKGKRIIAYLYGADNERDYRGFGFVSGRDVNLWSRFRNAEGTVLLSFASYLASGWREAAGAYALESGRCARCNRLLTVPASIECGYGPECAEIVGVA